MTSTSGIEVEDHIIAGIKITIGMATENATTQAMLRSAGRAGCRVTALQL